MVLNFVQKTIAERIGIEKPKEVGLDFSFVNDHRIDDDEFLSILEELEEEMQIELVDITCRFETVKQLVDYINRHI